MLSFVALPPAPKVIMAARVALACAAALASTTTALATTTAARAAIVEYSLRYTDSLPLARGWEHQHAVAALGGLANRAAPALYTPYTDADTMWFNRSTVAGGWLADARVTSPGVCAV